MSSPESRESRQQYPYHERRQVERDSPGYPRYVMTEEDVLRVAQKAVELAKVDIYSHVKKEFSADLGAAILNKIAYITGVSVLGAFLWMGTHGFIKL